MPPHREVLVIQRILIRHGFTQQMADTLLTEMQAALVHLAAHPPAPASGAASASSNHSGR
jgi:glutamate decarboxylase